MAKAKWLQHNYHFTSFLKVSSSHRIDIVVSRNFNQTLNIDALTPPLTPPSVAHMEDNADDNGCCDSKRR